jgi:hypothetical protein
MPTCVQSIQTKIDDGQLDSITELVSNTVFPISINASQKQLFLLNIVQQETAQFTISLVAAIPPTNIGVTVNIYQLIGGNTILLLGTVLITELSMSFQKDFTVGTYIICIGSTSTTYTGTFVGEFTGYQIYSKLTPRAYTGQALNPFDLEFSYIEKECNKLLYFDIVDGALPEGLQMTLTGDIWGVLPNLDCTDDTAVLSPSQNWYFAMDNSWQPWGNQWRFKLKVWIAELPDVMTEDWFCIRIHNNWSWDRDNQPPIEYEEEIVQEIEVEPLPAEVCCEGEAEPEPLVLQPLPITLCPCETETTQEQEVILNFLQWYENVLKNPPGEDSPYIQTFIDNFKKSEYFQKMIVKAGIVDDLLTDEERELKAVESLISYYTSQLKEGGRREEDIDYIMLTLKEQENQKLPTTVVTTTGTYLTVDLHED